MIDAVDPLLLALGTRREAVRFATTTMLPSGAIAAVQIVPQGDAFLVTDDGSAIEEALMLGIDVKPADTKRGREIAERFGLVFEDGLFSARHVAIDQIAWATSTLGEAAREWAQGVVDRHARATRTSLRGEVKGRLQAALPQAQIDFDRELVGASTRKHRFDLVVQMHSERKAVIEIVAPNPLSLASTHLKLFDLKQAHPDWPREVVTERLKDWDSPDMVLLSGVASHVREIGQDWGDLAITLQ